MIERIHLKIVQAVEQHGSLTAAADVLCVTQSALSHAIRKLENNLGTAVWLREGRSLRLTQAGQYLLTVADRVLPLFQHAEGQGRSRWVSGARYALAWSATLVTNGS